MWLEGIVQHLETVGNPLCRFISSVCIATCSSVCYYVSQLNRNEFVFPLLRMLHIQPDVENRTCSNVSVLFSITDKTYR